jgi:hypothetical protein
VGFNHGDLWERFAIYGFTGERRVLHTGGRYGAEYIFLLQRQPAPVI